MAYTEDSQWQLSYDIAFDISYADIVLRKGTIME